MQHSELQPTSRYARRGDVLTVTVPAGAPAVELRIGLYGVTSMQNDGAQVDFAKTPLQVGTQRVTAAVDGMVFLASTAGTEGSVVTIAGGSPVPTWLRGPTTRADFDAQLAAYPNVPYIEVVGERIFGDNISSLAVQAEFANENRLDDYLTQLATDDYLSQPIEQRDSSV